MKKGVKNSEIKLMLSSFALADEFELSDNLKSFFKVKKPAQRMRIWYLDTGSQQLMLDDWSVRYRYHEHCDFELTYKKRFSQSKYEAMLDTNEDSVYRHFKPEIDMGYTKKTYSLSYVKKFPLTDDLMDLDVETARHHAIVHAPSVLIDWKRRSYGLSLLDHSELFGPVYAMEYRGKYQGHNVTFEVWKLDGYLSEISLDVHSDKAEKLHRELLAELQMMRLLLPKNILKTQALFDHYAQKRAPVTV